MEYGCGVGRGGRGEGMGYRYGNDIWNDVGAKLGAKRDHTEYGGAVRGLKGNTLKH